MVNLMQKVNTIQTYDAPGHWLFQALRAGGQVPENQ
jgi:hypothetical protein